MNPRTTTKLEPNVMKDRLARMADATRKWNREHPDDKADGMTVAEGAVDVYGVVTAAKTILKIMNAQAWPDESVTLVAEVKPGIPPFLEAYAKSQGKTLDSMVDEILSDFCTGIRELMSARELRRMLEAA